jgi:hypothetical protein
VLTLGLGLGIQSRVLFLVLFDKIGVFFGVGVGVGVRKGSSVDATKKWDKSITERTTICYIKTVFCGIDHAFVYLNRLCILQTFSILNYSCLGCVIV